jgi:hypothetical protein
VKSLAGIPVSTAELTPLGLQNDRRWMIVDDDDEFVTQREVPMLATLWVEVDDHQLCIASAQMSAALEMRHGESTGQRRRVRVWNDSVDALHVSLRADRWLSEAIGRPVRLVAMDEKSRRPCSRRHAREGEMVSFADGYPLLITSQRSLDDLNQRITSQGGKAVPMSRFRPNLVIDGTPAWAEDGWGEVSIDGVRMRVVKPCGRCQVTTIDQRSGEVVGPEPLATLSTFRDSADYGVTFGQNAVPEALGALRVGSPVEIRERL